MSIKEARKILNLYDIDVLTDAILKSKYRQLMKECHPDRHQNEPEEVLARLNQQAVDINNAYDYLKTRIDEYNRGYGKTTGRSSSFDAEPDMMFFVRKASVIKNMKAYFENCSNSILRKQVIKFYKEDVRAEDMMSEATLRDAVNKFRNGIHDIYTNYEMFHRIDNGIPKHFIFNIDYNCNCDEFLTQLETLKSTHEKTMFKRVYNSLRHQFGDEEYVMSMECFKDEVTRLMCPLFSYTISPEEERGIIESIGQYGASVNRYFEKRKDEFYKLRKQIINLPDEFNLSGFTKDEFLVKLDESIIARKFDTVKTLMKEDIIKFKQKHKLIKKLHLMFIAKYNMALLRLDDHKDQDRIQGIYSTLAEVNKILADAIKGKYELEDLTVLEGISFKDKAMDDFVISMVGNGEYKIYVTMPKNEKMGYKNYEPFALNTPDKSQFVTLGQRDAILSDTYAYARDNIVIPVSEFIERGRPVFKYRYHGQIVEFVLYDYFGYELACELDRKSQKIVSFYVTDSKKHDVLYRQAEVSDILPDIEEYVSELYEPYISRMQGRTLNKKSINIKG